MESEEQKTCPNCKREIPAVNFTIHTVHCARNIRMCPVCKEPVPQAELEEHHEKLHKLMPCKQCGEKVCGTDLEDHIRDSCGQTIKSCRYCELELPRRELPAHEGYCGVRTEQCPDCREWVMIKYRQLHLDSNHGFLRLDDDPVPQPKKELPKITNVPKPANLPKATNLPKTTNVPQASTSNGYVPSTSFTKNTNILHDHPKTEIRYYGSSNNGPSTSNGVEASSSSVARPANAQNMLYNGINKPKRTNDRPQINTNVMAVKEVDKEPISRGAVKKRPAPKPPAREPPTRDPKREMAYHSALLRSQQEEKRRDEQNTYNLAHEDHQTGVFSSASQGLPPVLSPAAKVEKLRKMDALHNRELENTDYKNRLQGRVWMDRTHVPIGNVLGSEGPEGSQYSQLAAERRRGPPPAQPGLLDHTDDFSDLKPMTPQEFMDRFKELQLRRDGAENNNARGDDRFSQIKSSLRELRRGLNEVTAPYNMTNLNAANHSSRRPRSPRSPRSPRRSPESFDMLDVELPCEFCGAPVPADSLVQHQTGCRPDLAQFRPGSSSPRSPSPRAPSPRAAPVIPCEFCAASLPVYLISEHQERCGRDSNRLYAD